MRQRAVERRFDESRRLGFVGEVEPGIDAGLERELVQQREAEGVDGADADVVERVADLAPARRVEAALAVPLPQRRHHALAHFRGRLAREGDRQDVARRDAGFEQPHVAIDQDARLAGARRRLEGDVPQRIDRQPPRPRVRRLLQRLAAPRRNRSAAGQAFRSEPSVPSVALDCLSLLRARPDAGRPRRTRTSCRDSWSRAVADSGRRQCRRAPRPGDARPRPSAPRTSLPRSSSGTTACGPSNDRYIASLARMSRPCVFESDVLHARAVDRQLQRLPPVGHVFRLVVDQPERAVVQQIDAIDLGAQAHVARPRRPRRQT